jgi:hypothetical protein
MQTILIFVFFGFAMLLELAPEVYGWSELFKELKALRKHGRSG